MKGNDIIRKISVYNVQEWEFIVAMLDKELIEKTAENFANRIPYSAFDEFAEFGLDDEIDETADCLNVLMRKASKKMWKGISKEQANTLLKSMAEMNIVSVEMPGCTKYTAKDIVKAWKDANEVGEGE